MAEAVASATTMAALTPKKYMPAMVVGAQGYQNIAHQGAGVLPGLRTCGAVDI